MSEDEIIRIPTMEAFNTLLDALNLTDRQREIFINRYSRGMFLADISVEMDIDKKTVIKELKEIRKKVREVNGTTYLNPPPETE